MSQLFDAKQNKTDRRKIETLRGSEWIKGVYAIKNPQIGRTRADKPYLRCLIADNTGEIPGRVWTLEEGFEAPSEGFVLLEGETQTYQGEVQLIIKWLKPVEPTDEDLRELVPCSKRPPEEMFAELLKILGTIKHPAMQALAKVYLADETLMSAFKRAPAAKSIHHSYLGGLLEHTLNLVKLADAVCPLYPKINRDIVIIGLFLHDLGKTRELTYDRGFGYSDHGELIGHVVDGAIMLHDKAQQVMREHGVRLPPGALMVLQHIIISHHGEPEFGAAKVPMTPEAILVSMLDNIDAKTTIALAEARPDRAADFDAGGNFTEKIWALDTKLFKPDPLA
jgi:3'-5' exoribonuclease